MKKTILLLCAALALCACSKEQPLTVEETTGQSPEEAPVPITFNLSVAHPDEATKALKDGWEAGDVVYVFFREIPVKYLKLSFDGTSWTASEPGGEFVNADFSGLPDSHKMMKAVHIPHYEVVVSYDAATYRFCFRDASGNCIYTYYMDSNWHRYSVSGTTVSGKLDMVKPSGFVQFFVPGIAEADAPLYRLREANLQPESCSSLDAYIFSDYKDPGYCLEGFAYKGGVLFAGVLNSAGVATDYSFQLVKNVSAEKPVVEGTYVLAAKKNIPEGVVVRFPALSSWSYGKWVDMGSAGKWATGNLTDDGGATKGEVNIVAPDAAGKYYAWGETVGHAPSGTYFSHRFDWANYQLANGADDKLTKYCYDASCGNEGFTDTLTELEGIDDAATMNLGSAWRMPTKAECEELVNTTRFVWQWQDNAYAINGKLVTCKDTGLSLFLPAAGNGYSNTLLYSGEEGFYWTSAITPVYPTWAYSLITAETYNQLSPATIRKVGQSIRPVYTGFSLSFNLGGNYSSFGDEWDPSGGYGGGGNYNGFGNEYEM